jgi:YVTN family beta-propeller protein
MARSVLGVVAVLVVAVLAIGAGSASAAPLPPWTAFVANYGDGNITPIDLTQPSVLPPIADGLQSPQQMVMSPDAQTLYVAENNSESGLLERINAVTGQPEATLQVAPDYPNTNTLDMAISPDGSTLYVLTFTEGDQQFSSWNSIVQIDLPSFTVRQANNLPDDGDFIVNAIAVNDTTVWMGGNDTAAYGDFGVIWAVSAANLAIEDAYVLSKLEIVYGLALTPDQSTLIAVGPGFDTPKSYVEQMSTAGANGPAASTGITPTQVTISPDGQTAWINDHPAALGETVGAYDISANTIQEISASTWPYSLALTPDGSYLMVANKDENAVEFINTQTRQVDPVSLTVGDSPYGIAVTPDQAPSAGDIAVSSDPAVNEPVQFSAPDASSPLGQIASWDWDFGDGTQSSDAAPTHSYSAPGQYTVSLTVTNSGGTSTEVTGDGHVVFNNGGPSAATSTTVDVGLNDPTFSANATPSVVSGEKGHDFAQISGGVVPPTGTITFTLFGASDPTCTGTPLVTQTFALPPSGAVTSDPVKFLALGTHRWVAAYSGDSGYNPAATVCGEADQLTVVSPAALLGAPAITSITPRSAISLGGDRVQITGTNFSGLTGVTFDGIPATVVSLDSDRQITVIAPPHPGGDVDVQITTIYGVSSVGHPASRFTYLPTATRADESAPDSSPSSTPSTAATCVVPKVTGISLAGARRSLTAAHCQIGRVRRQVSRRAPGTVLAQGHTAGASMAVGTKVNVRVARRPTRR